MHSRAYEKCPPCPTGDGLDDLKFVSQNVNSLCLNSAIHLAKYRENFEKKMISVLKSHADFILLSDTRICKNSLTFQNYCNTNSIEKYVPFFTVTNEAKRGVAILAKQSLDLSYELVNSDVKGNFITIKCFKPNEPHKFFLICSIYGPLQNDSPTFINQVLEPLTTSNRPFVVGGDWNTTPSDIKPPELET